MCFVGGVIKDCVVNTEYGFGRIQSGTHSGWLIIGDNTSQESILEKLGKNYTYEGVSNEEQLPILKWENDIKF